MTRAGVFVEHSRACLADFPPEIRALTRTEAAGRGLRIVGDVGVGKSHLAAALVGCEILRGCRARMVLAADLFDAIRETFGSAQQSQRVVVDEYCNVGTLVIDDLGREMGHAGGNASEFLVAQLHRILSRRNGDFRRTILTTNLTLNEIEERYDISIRSRVSLYQTIVLGGHDRREHGGGG